MIKKIQNTELVKPLFAHWNETLIWSCLQGVMGEIYVDCIEKPVSAMAILGDFLFLAGTPKEELVLFRPKAEHKNFIIMVPQNDAWAKLIERCFGKRAKKKFRYAMKKEPNVFDRSRLEQIVAMLPKEDTMKLIDEEIYHKCKQMDWCRDWVSQYKSYTVYCKCGVGVVILRDGEVISGASSYTSYQGGIEIQIDTKEQYRRNGLAYIAGAKLIIECLERNLYPSWDAENRWSVGLAEKLGYHYSHTYVVYEILEY